MPAKKKKAKKTPNAKDVEIARLTDELAAAKKDIDRLVGLCAKAEENAAKVLAQAEGFETRLDMFEGIRVEVAGPLRCWPMNGNVCISLPVQTDKGKKRVWGVVAPHAAISFTQTLGAVARRVKAGDPQAID